MLTVSVLRAGAVSAARDSQDEYFDAVFAVLHPALMCWMQAYLYQEKNQRVL